MNKPTSAANFSQAWCRDQLHVAILHNFCQLKLFSLSCDVHDLCFAVIQVQVMNFNEIPEVVIWPEKLCSPASQALIDVSICEQSTRCLRVPIRTWKHLLTDLFASHKLMLPPTSRVQYCLKHCADYCLRRFPVSHDMVIYGLATVNRHNIFL